MQVWNCQRNPFRLMKNRRFDRKMLPHPNFVYCCNYCRCWMSHIELWGVSYTKHILKEICKRIFNTNTVCCFYVLIIRLIDWLINMSISMELFYTNRWWYCIKKVKLASVVDGDPKAHFSIAITPRRRGGRYFFPWIVPLPPRFVP